jgi:cation:H+ antiporter
VVYSISGGHVQPMILDGRQSEEIFLTAAQSLLALVLLANLSFGLWEGVLLLGLFVLQFVFPTPEIRTLLAFGYLVIAAGCLFARSYRSGSRALLKFGWRA